MGGRGLLVILANIRWLWEVVGYFDNSVQCWKVLGGFECLRLVLGSWGWLWLVTGSFWLVVGGFGCFRVVAGGFGWLQVVACFIIND